MEKELLVYLTNAENVVKGEEAKYCFVLAGQLGYVGIPMNYLQTETVRIRLQDDLSRAEIAKKAIENLEMWSKRSIAEEERVRAILKTEILALR